MQSAEGGTLFLDEVADLPLHMQVKLLRVIQEKTVRPIGEQREAPIDVRILSATHKNLVDLVAESRFREDLYYRINVIEIRVPPLRERRNDIRPLAEAILGAARKAHRPHRPEAECRRLARARDLRLPRQRARARERAGARRHAERQRHHRGRAHPVAGRAARHAAAAAPASRRGHEPRARAALTDQLEHLERDAIIKALEQTRYNKTAAAKLLGVTYRALRYKIQKLEIE